MSPPCRFAVRDSSKGRCIPPLLVRNPDEYLQLPPWKSGITGPAPARRCLCAPARLPGNAARFEAKRRVWPTRAVGRNGATGRPPRRRCALPAKCSSGNRSTVKRSFGNTSPDLVQPGRGRAQMQLGRTQKYDNRTDHRDSTGKTSSKDSTNSRDIPTLRNSHTLRASRPKAPSLTRSQTHTPNRHGSRNRNHIPCHHSRLENLRSHR